MDFSSATSRHVLFNPLSDFLREQNAQLATHGFIEQTVSWKAAVNGIQRVQKASWTRWNPFTASFHLIDRWMKQCVATCAFCWRRKPGGGLKRTCRLVAQLTSTWRSHGALADHSNGAEVSLSAFKE